MERRLYRSPSEKYIAGVCGGLGEYFGVDPAFVRILFVLLTFASGFGLLAYLIFWITVRKRPIETAVEPATRDYSHAGKYLAGITLIVLGVVFFIHQNIYWFDFEDVWDKFWPVVLIALGLVLLLYKRRSPERVTDNSYTAPHQQNGGATV